MDPMFSGEYERDGADGNIQPNDQRCRHDDQRRSLNRCNVLMIERGDYRASAHARAGGFTLLEVMVAVVVTAIGLLGIAKIQALAYASTTTASVRSLVALQASGLAASMHADRP